MVVPSGKMKNVCSPTPVWMKWISSSPGRHAGRGRPANGMGEAHPAAAKANDAAANSRRVIAIRRQFVGTAATPLYLKLTTMPFIPTASVPGPNG